MTELTDFLLARIAEDEAVVEHPAEHERDGGYTYADVGGIGEVLTVGTDRVLAECAAKRAIVEAHPHPSRYTCCENCHAEALNPPPHCDTVLALATIYSNHPGYRQEWTPNG